MQTLQDVIDAVSVIPERYGHSSWKNCPIAKEVLRDVPLGGRDTHKAARMLNCPEKHTISFIVWWDGLCGRALTFPYDIYDLSKAKQSGKALRKYGYTVPDEKHMVELIREGNSQKEG